MGFIFRIFLLLSVSFALLGGCTPKKEKSVQNDPLESAYQKIDRGDYNAAIAELEAMNDGDPRPRVREALASAYAARAGLFIQNYWGFLVGFQAPLVNIERVDTGPTVSKARKILTQLDGQPATTGNHVFGQLARVFGTMELWAERIDRLPVVDGTARADVDRALAVLDQIPSRGGRLYRALLGLVVFKSDLNNGFEGWARVEKHLKKLDFKNPTSPINKALLCQIDVKAFAAWAGNVIYRLSNTAGDVAAAFPSKQPELNGAVNESARISRELQRAGEGECF